MPTRYSKIFNEGLQKQQRILPICRSLKAEDICGEISSEMFLVVVTDIYFVVPD